MKAGAMHISKQGFSFSKAALCLILLFCAVFANHFRNWGPANHPFVMDIDQYYSYLHTWFIDHRLSFYPVAGGHTYWLIETPTQHYVPKVTYGMSLFYAPFFLLARLFAGSGSTGYEPLYAWSVHTGCMLYSLAGLWYCRKTLLLWLDELSTAISLLLLFFGTNLLYYMLSESEAVHGILFLLISVFIYHVMKWYLLGAKKHFLYFMLAGGFIVLIRPTELMLFVIPLLIGVTSLSDIQAKLKQLPPAGTLLSGLLLFMLPILPQMMFWKMASGSFLFFSYGSSERFYWSDPQLLNLLLSFRKGWLVYTPIMIFGLAGFMVLYARNRKLFFTLLAYFVLNVYVASCWWDWAYGGSFGMRALVHVYAVLIIPFAYFVQWAVQLLRTPGAFKKAGVYALACMAALLCALNVFQANLYKHHIIHWDSMTREAYSFVFLKRHYSDADKMHIESLLKHPDYAAMRAGQRDE